MQLLRAVQQADRASLEQLAVVCAASDKCAWLLDSLKVFCDFDITGTQKQSFDVFANRIRSSTSVEQLKHTAGGQLIWARKERTAGVGDVWAYLQSQHKHKAHQGQP